MNRFSPAEHALRDLESPDEPPCLRRSTGDILRTPPSEAAEGRPQPLRSKSLSVHHDSQEVTLNRLAGDDPPGEQNSSDTARLEEGAIASSEITPQSHSNEGNWREDVTGVFIWSPSWLQPVVLGIFAGLFFCAAVTVAVMLWYSEKNQGFCETRAGLEYIWRFSPTGSKWPRPRTGSLVRLHSSDILAI